MPERFGKYVLEQRLASGGMAELFRAIADDAPDCPVVVKRVLPSVRSDPAYAELLRDEGRIGAALDHANVARTLDAGDIDGVVYLVLEHVDGVDLATVLRRIAQRGGRELPLEHAITVALALGAGLAHAHAHGIVHRDVSPSNVMLARSGEVKLIDFGLATRADAPIDHEAGTARGTASYMSPEQARGDRVDERSDVFALGVLLFELTTSKRLFVGSSTIETLELVRSREAPPPSDVRDGYPPGLEPIVMRALAKAPDARYPSAEAMSADVEAFAQESTPEAGPRALARFMKALGF